MTVWKQEGLAGRARDIPEDASSNGCGWPESVTVPIPAEWKSGYYHVALRIRDNGGKYVRRNARTAEASCYFVLREAPGIAEPSPVLLQL